MIALVPFVVSSVGLRHALGFAADLHRRCVVNREAAKHVAQELGLEQEQTEGAVRLLKAHPRLSPERLALVAMLDPGLDDGDIAEIFGRSPRWAAVVRSQADEIRAEEHIPIQLEYLDSGLQPGDPMPGEIKARAAELRRYSPRRDGSREPAIRSFSWTGHAFLSIRAC